MKASNNSDIALLILRIAMGGLMAIHHGWGKAVKLFTGNPEKFADPIGLGSPVSLGLASFAELICAVLIVLGWYTRWAVMPLIITMFVAVFVVHIDDPFKKMELGLIYLSGYMVIGLMGPGWYSLDAQVRKV